MTSRGASSDFDCEGPPPPAPLCRRFLIKGRCWSDPAHGGGCPFSHALPDPSKSLEEVRSEMMCPFLGRCKYVGRGSCLFSHKGDPFPHRTPEDKKEKTTREPGKKSGGERPKKKKKKKKKAGAKHGGSSDEEGGEPCCGVCLEVPPVSEDSKDWARYALLPGCDHVFCISCLQQWRAANKSVDDNNSGETTLDKALVKCCPTCRTPSRFCVPSDKYYKGKSKEKIVEQFLIKKARKSCRSYKVGRLGSCPFGSECFYLHPDHNGSDMKAQDEKADVLFRRRKEAYMEQRYRRRRRRLGIDSAEEEMALLRGFMGLLTMFGETGGEDGTWSEVDPREAAMALEVLGVSLPHDLVDDSRPAS